MADISESELTVINNTASEMLDALSEDESDVATALKEKIAEIQQIVSSKQQQGQEIGDTGPTGGAGFPPGMQQMMQQQQTDGPTMDIEEFKAIGGHLQEAMSIIQKVLGQGQQGAPQ